MVKTTKEYLDYWQCSELLDDCASVEMATKITSMQCMATDRMNKLLTPGHQGTFKQRIIGNNDLNILNCDSTGDTHTHTFTYFSIIYSTNRHDYCLSIKCDEFKRVVFMVLTFAHIVFIRVLANEL